MSITAIRSCARGLSAALALSIGLAGAARADSTEVLSFQGSFDHEVDCWEVPDGCGPDGPPPDVTGPWTGDVDVTLSSWADGTYDVSAADVVLNSGLGGFDSSGWGGFYFFGSVSVSGGRVSSIDATWYYPDDPDVSLTFQGLSMSYDQPDEHQYGQTLASATLHAVGMVPEPAGWALVLAGLGVVAARRMLFVGRASRDAA